MILAENKKAKFDYDILEYFEAGIVLKGFEVKAIKSGKIQISGAYAIIRQGEVWLINANISPYQEKNINFDFDTKRNRKLLLKKQEIKYLIGKQEQKLTLIPLLVYTKGRKKIIKIKLGLGKIRKKKDKRELIKEREIEKEIKKGMF